MNKETISAAITEIKTDVSQQMWQQRIAACQRSGLSVREWCRENGIVPGTYYKHLRKLREEYCREIVPLHSECLTSSSAGTSGNIEIRSENVYITVPVNSPTDVVLAILRELKSC